MKRAVGSIIAVTAFSFSALPHFASASPILVNSDTSVYKRSCPSVGAPNYISDWKDAILEFSDWDSNGLVDANEACHFNGGNQERFYNTDGSAKYPGLPAGVPYTLDDIGNVQIVSNTSTTTDLNESWGTPIDLNAYSVASFYDGSGITLPDHSVAAYSEANERNSANAYSDVSYYWTGESTSLTFSADLRIDTSSGIWSDGELDVADWITSNNLYVSIDDAAPMFSTFDNTVLGAGATAFFDTMSINFDVDKGTKFTLGMGAQALGLNGGWAANQMYNGNLVSPDVDNMSDFISTTQVPEPSSVLMTAMGLFGLAFMNRRRKQY